MFCAGRACLGAGGIALFAVFLSFNQVLALIYTGNKILLQHSLDSDRGAC